jgi:hypothetical protein
VDTVGANAPSPVPGDIRLQFGKGCERAA